MSTAPHARRFFSLFLHCLLLLLLLAGCFGGGSDSPPGKELHPNEAPVGPEVIPLPNPDLGADSRRLYMGDLGLVPREADHFALVDNALHLTDAELARLAQNGFVLSERAQWSRFLEAYAWIYWKDLPVLVTTDSILQSVHQSYSDLLSDIETRIVMDELRTLLQATLSQLHGAAQANRDPALAPLYTDLDDYIRVALVLLANSQPAGGRVRDWAALATSAGSVSEVELFGATYPVDFTLFTPRGHYTRSDALKQYFRALNWLAQVDFRIVTFNPDTSEPVLNPQAVAVVALLRDALDQAGQRERWQAIDTLFAGLVGRSDNMLLTDFDRFWRDMRLAAPADALAVPPEQMLVQLTRNDYGQQRITGQIISRAAENTSTAAIPRPVSFMLLGQRFAIDSYVFSSLVYDRLMLDGNPVLRPLPAPLDVMYALGNDRAATHLAGELDQYHYAGHLAALRRQIDGFPDAYWSMPVYNGWLGLIRSLSAPTLDARYPQALRTAAWADKTLQTQLASWAQLRHDNLLYVKQSMTTAMAVCEYPAGYVEPYPAFYAALAAYAQTGQRALGALNAQSLSADAQQILQRALDHFGNVQVIAGQLQNLAEKELRHEPFTPDEELFLKSVVKSLLDAVSLGCGGPVIEEHWDGWYGRLFYTKDDNPAVIADVHTNPNYDPQSPLYPPTVLHVATGPTALLFLLVETDSGTGLFVGPAYTYFERVEEGAAGNPPKRLDDDAWRTLLAAPAYPQGPAWTANFRLPSARPPELLWLDPHGLPTATPTPWPTLPPTATPVPPTATPVPTPTVPPPPSPLETSAPASLPLGPLSTPAG